MTKSIKWQFMFRTGLDKQDHWTNPDEMYAHFDREMITENMITGYMSRYIWGPNKKTVLMVRDEHKGDKHLEDVTDANTYWVWRVGFTVYICHDHHFKTNNIDPKNIGAYKCHISEEVIDTVWELMFEGASEENGDV